MEIIKNSLKSFSEKLGVGIPKVDTVFRRLFWLMVTLIVMTFLFQYSVDAVSYWFDVIGNVITTFMSSGAEAVVEPAASGPTLPELGFQSYHLPESEVAVM